MKSLKVNDKVKVIAGEFKGEESVIVAVDRKAGKAQVDGLLVRERHYRKSYMRPNGGKASVQGWIDLSNLKGVKDGK